MSAGPRKGSLFVIFLTVFVDLLGFGIVLPLLPIYAEKLTTDTSGLTLGALMSSFSIMQFLFAPVWGRLSDRIGRRPVLIVGLTGSTLSYALFGWATSVHSLSLMFASRIGAGIAGATISTAQAYIADVTTKENRARGMALIGAAFGLGFTFGPLLAATAIYSRVAEPDGKTPCGQAVTAENIQGRGVLIDVAAAPKPSRPESAGLPGRGTSEFEFELPRDNRYQIELRYATKAPRTVDVSINGNNLGEGADNTESDEPDGNQREWHFVALDNLKAGKNVVQLENEGRTSPVDRILVIRLPDLSPWPGYTAAGLSAIALSLAIFMLPESLTSTSQPSKKRWFDFGSLGEAIRVPTVGGLLSAWFIGLLGFTGFEAILSFLLALEKSKHGFGYKLSEVLPFFAAIGLVHAFAQGLVRALAKRYSEAVLATGGSIVTIIGFFVLVAATSSSSFSLLVTGIVVVATGFAFIPPTMQALISRRSDPTKQGGILGVGQSLGALARILGHGLCFPLFYLTATVPFWAGAILMGVALVFIILNAYRGQDFASPKTSES